ncbi:hypothetical protein AALA73_07380 [Parasutterella excrementihominis]|uniref:hypothetical protein n=1 Tax=Parasutterella excrementihominis TaxID=487175 RepID=UPI00351160C1
MKIRNIAFIVALTGWLALAVYYVAPSETAIAKEVQTAPKTVGETLSAIAQGFKHEGEEKRKQLRIEEGKQVQSSTPSGQEQPKETMKVSPKQK